MPQRITRIMRIDDMAITTANRTTEVGAATGVAGALAHANWIGWLGLLVAIVGLLANIYFQRRRDRRERAEHQARMESIEKRCER